MRFEEDFDRTLQAPGAGRGTHLPQADGRAVPVRAV